MEVQHRLRLDRRIVADSHCSIRFALAQRFRGFHDREHAAYAVIGDACVRALQPVPDAHVAEHVVRKGSQQPHRIDVGIELAPEGRQIVFGSAEQRDVVILTLVAAAAGPDIDARALAELDCKRLV
jgi:hypothetical protein